jgi:hypothetical protein
MPFVPEISAELSEPPEFSGDVWEKDLSTGWARTIDLQITNQILFHCETAFLFRCVCGIYYDTFRPLLAAGFSGCFCFYWPGFSCFLLLLATGFSGGICSCLLGFSGLNFSGMGM